MRKTIAIAGAILAVSIALTGCTVPGHNGGAAPAGDDKASSAPADDSSSGTIKFGAVWKYDDGVTITVAKPVSFKPSKYSAGADQKANLKLTITITNGSTKNLDPVAIGKMTSGGTAGSSIIDLDAKLNGFPPTATVLPGKSITWSEGWSVADPADLTYQTSPGFLYDDAIFVS